MKYIATLFGVLFVAYNVHAQKVGVKSRIDFEVSNFKVNTVEGSIGDIRGKVRFDPSKPSEASFDVQIGIASLKTDNEERDAHLQEEEFFYASKHPNARFVSTSVEKREGMYWIKGKLTIRGVTKEVNIPFERTELKGGQLLTGKLEVDRYDYKVGSSSGFSIGRKIELKILCYLVD